MKDNFTIGGVNFTTLNFGIFTIIKSTYPQPFLVTDYDISIVFHKPGDGGQKCFSGYRCFSLFTKHKNSEWWE